MAAKDSNSHHPCTRSPDLLITAFITKLSYSLVSVSPTVTEYFAIPMDAVGNSSLCQATAAQGCFVGGQQQIVMIHAQLAQLHTTMISMATSIPAHPQQIAHPDKFADDLNKCKGFMLQYSLNFTCQEGLSEHTKIAHFTNLLMDKVLTWATTI